MTPREHRSARRASWLASAACALMIAACGAPPQVDPSLGSSREAVLRAMREASAEELPPPPATYALPQGWDDLNLGCIVAIDGPMVAVWFDRSKQLPEGWRHQLIPIGDRTQQGTLKGDVVVASRLGEVMIGRFFPRPADNRNAPQLGDEAHLDVLTRAGSAPTTNR
jgi:hypothetical protein